MSASVKAMVEERFALRGPMSSKARVLRRFFGHNWLCETSMEKQNLCKSIGSIYLHQIWNLSTLAGYYKMPDKTAEAQLCLFFMNWHWVRSFNVLLWNWWFCEGHWCRWLVPFWWHWVTLKISDFWKTHWFFKKCPKCPSFKAGSKGWNEIPKIFVDEITKPS